MKDWFKKLLCRHSYRVIKWRMIHWPHYEPARRQLLSRCHKCGKEKNWLPSVPRNKKWENNNRHLETSELF